MYINYLHLVLGVGDALPHVPRLGRQLPALYTLQTPHPEPRIGVLMYS